MLWPYQTHAITIEHEAQKGIRVMSIRPRGRRIREAAVLFASSLLVIGGLAMIFAAVAGADTTPDAPGIEFQTDSANTTERQVSAHMQGTQ